MNPSRQRCSSRGCGVLLAGALALASCAERTPQVPPPLTPALAPGAPYRIKVGDALDIRFYKTPELNIEVPVRSDGKVSLELVGEVQAAGLSPEALSGELTQRYASELTSPKVTVIVRSFGGSVYVGGEVKGPSSVPFATGLTALQAIDSAGYFLTSGRRDHVVLIRREPDGYKGYRLALNRALSGEDLAADVPLQATDILYVPRSRIGNLNLFVEQYIRNSLPFQGIPIPAF